MYKDYRIVTITNIKCLANIILNIHKVNNIDDNYMVKIVMGI